MANKTFGQLVSTAVFGLLDEIVIWQSGAAKRVTGAIFKKGINIAPNVIDLGADPTGVADSTAAFNLATGATLVHGGNEDLGIRRFIDIPAGDFVISGPVYVRNGQHLRGSGEGCTRIMLAGTTFLEEHIFKLGMGLIDGVPTHDAGGAPPEISELWTYGGPQAHSVVYATGNGYSIHNLFMTSPGVGILALGDSGRIHGIQIDQCLSGLVIGGQNHVVSDSLFYIPNYAITTAAGKVADITFTNVQIYYPTNVGIQLSSSSDISDLSFTGVSAIMNMQYGSFVGMIVQQANYANNVRFNECLFANWVGYCYKHQTGIDSHVEFNNCVFDGKKTVAGYSQSTTAIAASVESEKVLFNNCTFKNLLGAPIHVNGSSSLTTVVVNGGYRADNYGSSFIDFGLTYPLPGSQVIVNNMLGYSGDVTHPVFGSANSSGWSLGSDIPVLLTGTGIGTTILVFPVGPKSAYFVDTRTAAACVELPRIDDGTPRLRNGDSLTFIPYTATGTTWATNNVKFLAGDNKINGSALDLTVSVNAKLTFTYNGATGDWIVS